MTLVNEFVIEIHSFWKLFKLLLSPNKTKKKSEKKKKKIKQAEQNFQDVVSLPLHFLAPCYFQPLSSSPAYQCSCTLFPPPLSSLDALLSSGEWQAKWIRSWRCGEVMVVAQREARRPSEKSVRSYCERLNLEEDGSGGYGGANSRNFVNENRYSEIFHI